MGAGPSSKTWPRCPPQRGDDLGPRMKRLLSGRAPPPRRDRLGEARPAGAGVELVVGAEERSRRRPRSGSPGVLVVAVLARERRLGAGPAQDLVLLGRQLLAPFLIALWTFGSARHSHVLAPRSSAFPSVRRGPASVTATGPCYSDPYVHVSLLEGGQRTCRAHRISLRTHRAGRRRSRFGVDAGHEHYKWWALSCTSLGMLLAATNSGTLIIALPDLERSPTREPAGSGLGDPGLPDRRHRPGPDGRPSERPVRPQAGLRRRLRRFCSGLAGGRLLVRCERPDRLAGSAGNRLGLPVRKCRPPW